MHVEDAVGRRMTEQALSTEGEAPLLQGRWLLVALAILSIVARIAVFPIQSDDYVLYLHPWIEYIEQHGGHRALAHAFSNYQPAYTYLLVCISYVNPAVSRLVLVKLLGLPFELFAALTAADIAAGISAERWRKNMSWTILLGLLVLPTVVLNNSAWGQCDIIYTLCLLLAFRSSLISQPRATILWFSASLAFKFQALFFAPFILVLLLARRISLRHLVFIPVMPALLAIPAVLEGRPPLEIATILIDQEHTYHALAMNVANPWECLQSLIHQKVLVSVACLLTVVVIAIYLYKAKRRQLISPDWLALSATASLALMPFCLPKMHDRYFFPAELFCAVLAFAIPSFRRSAALMQIASLLVYVNYLFHMDDRYYLHACLLLLAVCANTIAVSLLVARYFLLSHDAAVMDERVPE